MWSPLLSKLTLRFVVFGGLCLFAFSYLACGVKSTPKDKVILEIEADPQYLEFEKLLVIVSDSNGNTIDSLFNDSLVSADQLKNLSFPDYQGEKIQIRIIGFKNGKLVYSSLRSFNGSEPEDFAIDTIFTSSPPQANAGNDTTLFPGDPIHLKATAFDPFSTLFIYEWDFGNGDFIEVSKGDSNFFAPDSEATLSFILRVTDDEGLQGKDTIIIDVKYSDNSFIKTLEVFNQTLLPEFNKNRLNYEVEVEGGTEFVLINVKTDDVLASLQLEGASKEDSLYRFFLSTGSNLLKIKVTAANGDSSIYEIEIFKAANSESGLKELNSNLGIWDSSFSENQLEYHILIENSDDSLEINFETQDVAANVIYQKEGLGPKGSFNITDIPVGDTTIQFSVLAEDNVNSKEFTLNISKPALQRIVRISPTKEDSSDWQPVLLGEEFEYTDSPDEGYGFTHISSLAGEVEIADSNSTPPKWTALSDSAIIAVFYDTLKFQLEVNAEDGVSFTPNSAVIVNYDIPYPITSSGGIGYHFKQWLTLEGNVVYDDSTKVSTQVRLKNGDALISPIYAPDTFNVNFDLTGLDSGIHDFQICINNTCETEQMSFIQKRTYGEEITVNLLSEVGCVPQGPVACEKKCLSFLSFASIRTGAFGSSDSVLTVTIVDNSSIDANYINCP